MNLVCLEFVMAQEDNNPGVVMLSEFAGAKATLSHASINPHNILGTSKKIKSSFECPFRTGMRNTMKQYLLGYDSHIGQMTLWKDYLFRRIKK